jgi:carboxymethylenebutenolidase
MSDGVELAVTLYLPDSPDPQPCLLEALPYRKDDLTSSYAQTYERLRDQHGYAVCRVDLRGTGSSEGDATDEYPPEEQDDLTEVIAWLAGQEWCNGKVGIFGTCSGGRHALLVASRVKGFGAVGDLWGGGVVASPEQLTPKRPVAVIDYTKELTTPLIGIFGNEDQNPPPDQVDKHEAELKKHGKEYEFHRYDGAGHGFFYYHRGAYRPEQAMDAWEKLFAFFGKHLT